MKKIIYSFFAVSISFLSCKNSSPFSSEGVVQNVLTSSPLLKNSFTGFIICDAETKKVLFEQNADKYFTPASNTKLFTFYTALYHLGDQIPTLDYIETDTSLIFWGTGDPTFLHRSFEGNKAFDFLKKQRKPLILSTSNFYQKALGPGWSWDDYNDYYQVESTSFPIYGNTVNINYSDDKIETDPPIFTNTTYIKEEGLHYIKRALSTNEYFIPAQNGLYSQEIPIKTSEMMTQQLLMDTLRVNVDIANIPKPSNTKTIYGYDTAPVLAKMMKESDNFLAEHLLLLSSHVISDSISSNIAIEKMKSTFLKDSPSKLKWVDGSGLSRYNLFTPASIVFLLAKMRDEFGEAKIFPLMAQNGEEKSTVGSFSAENGVFLYAKSGTLTGVYNLSGYVKTKSGKTLVVSCMHNNFNLKASEVRKWTYDLYQTIYENY